MIQVPIKTEEPLNKQTVLSINQKRVQRPKTRQTIHSVNTDRGSGSVPSNSAAYKPVPALMHPMRKGQKISLESNGTLSKIRACLGWNVTNNSCDVDVSAFLLNAGGRVLGDDWFVFYGQKLSPDGSTAFSADSGMDRETISIDFHKLNGEVQKIVFVLTIHEALEKRLNFSMLKDAYVRIIDQASGLRSWRAFKWMSIILTSHP